MNKIYMIEEGDIGMNFIDGDDERESVNELKKNLEGSVEVMSEGFVGCYKEVYDEFIDVISEEDFEEEYEKFLSEVLDWGDDSEEYVREGKEEYKGKMELLLKKWKESKGRIKDVFVGSNGEYIGFIGFIVKE